MGLLSIGREIKEILSQLETGAVEEAKEKLRSLHDSIVEEAVANARASSARPMPPRHDFLDSNLPDYVSGFGDQPLGTI